MRMKLQLQGSVYPGDVSDVNDETADAAAVGCDVAAQVVLGDASGRNRNCHTDRWQL